MASNTPKAAEKPSLRRNFMLNSVLTASSIMFLLVSFPYVSRVLLDEGVGKVAFATSLVSYFAMLGQLGIPTYGVRACAMVRDDKEALSRTAQELLIIHAVMSAVSYALFLIALVAIPRLREEKALYLIISSTIFFQTIGMEWLYKAIEEYRYITIRSVIFKGIAMVAMLLLVKSQDDYMIYGGLTIFAASASNALNFIHARKHIFLKPLGGYHFRRHWKPVMIFFAMACATTIYVHLDTVMLGWITTDAEVGCYEAALKTRGALASMVTALGAVVLPRASYFARQGRYNELWSISRKAMSFIFLLATPLTVYFILFARDTLLVLSGISFLRAVPAMRVIMPTLLLVGITNVLGLQILVPLGRERVVLHSEIAGAVTDLALNMLLIPRLGATGAAVGTLAAEAVVLAVQYQALKGEVREIFHDFRYGRLLAAIMAGIAASLWVTVCHWNSLLSIIVAAVLFFGAYGLVLLKTGEPLAEEAYAQSKRLILQWFRKE